MIQDSPRHKGLRRKLIDELISKGIKEQNVLQAINSVPRHLFMDSSFINHAYIDKAFPISAGQTISQPYTVAFQTSLLEIKKGDKVLEIGTGSGYQAAVLIEMGAKVFTIERQKELFVQTKSFLPSIGYNPQMFYGDGYIGQPTYGPFDKVLITAAAPFIPEALLEQLKIGGVFVAPVGEKNGQTMMRIVKTSENQYDKKEYGKFMFVPMLKGKE